MPPTLSKAAKKAAAAERERQRKAELAAQSSKTTSATATPAHEDSPVGVAGSAYFPLQDINPLPVITETQSGKPTDAQSQKGESASDQRPSTKREQSQDNPAAIQNGKSHATTEDKGKEEKPPATTENKSESEPQKPATTQLADTPASQQETPAAPADTSSKPPTIPNGHSAATTNAAPNLTSMPQPSPSTTQPANPPPASSPHLGKGVPNISLNMNFPRTSPAKPKLTTSISPGVREVAEHAAKLKSVLAQVGAIYDMVGRQATQMAQISPAVLGTDQLNKIRDEMTASEDFRLQKLASIKKEVEDAKARLLKRGNDEISSIIKRVVSQQVKRRVKEQIEKRMREVETQLKGDAQVAQRRATLVNVEAKVVNSMIRTKWPREPLRPVMRPFPNPTASRKFPEDFNQLVKLNHADTRALIKEYQLEQSDSKLEDGHFENLNRLMSHFGVGYRVNPAGNMSILTSVWDR